MSSFGDKIKDFERNNGSTEYEIHKVRHEIISAKNTTAVYRGNRKEVDGNMPYSSRKLGLIISTERSARQMSQEQLSALAGISRGHLAALESGKKSPSLKTFWKLAEALSMKPSQLLAKLED